MARSGRKEAQVPKRKSIENHALSKCEKASTYLFPRAKKKASAVSSLSSDRNHLFPKDRGRRLHPATSWSSMSGRHPSRMRNEVDGAQWDLSSETLAEPRALSVPESPFGPIAMPFSVRIWQAPRRRNDIGPTSQKPARSRGARSSRLAGQNRDFGGVP